MYSIKICSLPIKNHAKVYTDIKLKPRTLKLENIDMLVYNEKCIHIWNMLNVAIYYLQPVISDYTYSSTEIQWKRVVQPSKVTSQRND